MTVATKERQRVCELDICDGSGYIPKMSQVYNNEPHVAYLGEMDECVCNMPDPDDRIEDGYDFNNYS